LEDVKGHVGEWTDYIHEEGDFWFGSHCDDEPYCLKCLTRRYMKKGWDGGSNAMYDATRLEVTLLLLSRGAGVGGRCVVSPWK
jgi:hypothetical protein